MAMPAPTSEAAAAKRADSSIRLEPESGVEIVGGELHAVSTPVWLRIEPIERIRRRAWVKLRYASGMFDDPVRPLIRFTLANGRVSIQPMNGPVLGTAEWVGRVPMNTVSVSISPGNRLGRIAFRIEKFESMTRRELIRAGFLADPPWALWSIRSRLLNSREEAWQALKYARGGTVFARYWDWHGRFSRPLELDGLDRPRADWSQTPAFHLFMPLDGGAADDLRATLETLRAQVYPHWFLHAVTGERTSPALLVAYREQMKADERFLEVSGSEGRESAGVAGDDRIAILACGDTLQDHTLASFAEAFAETPTAPLIYSDEDSIAPNGVWHSPVLKPDWSPVFFQAVPYLGRLTCLRHDALTAAGATVSDLLANESETLSRILTCIDPKTVGHIRRILYHRRAPPPSIHPAPQILARSGEDEKEPRWPEVSVIIPTRDRVDLLSACTRSLQEKTDYPNFNAVIVDNGSTQPEALAHMKSLRGDSRFKILERPIPFNYSRLCNDGAQETRAPMLVFLNNDIVFFDPRWLKAMVRWALRPEIGVVGAKLLFPNRRIQHAGVVLGMGGLSGHVYRRSALKERGYMNQLESPRETLANTAACIAIARDKFAAIGGFDAENLPVDLNDIDFCLRIAERGWQNLWTPEAIMIHAQSATRGIDKDPFNLYRQERTYFMHRWTEAIRDDRFFHPGLSLFSQRPVLA